MSLRYSRPSYGSINYRIFDSRVGEWVKIVAAFFICLLLVAIFAAAIMGGIHLLSFLVSSGW